MTTNTRKIDDSTDELPFEENFIEQAEYIVPEKFLALATEHPNEDVILKKLMGSGSKLLVGPRGCGKSTLMLKAFHEILRQNTIQSLPIYVNFKLSLKLEPFYVKGSNATYWFKRWLILKIILAVHDSFGDARLGTAPANFPKASIVSRALTSLESGDPEVNEFEPYSVEYLVQLLEQAATENGLSRCVLLIDDAAHSFSDKQQEDFFDFFRSIKSRLISPKAAIYPGITSHSPSFHVGHDAEVIDAWILPMGKPYEDFMMALAEKRFQGTGVEIVANNSDDIKFLAYSAFGIPRAFLGMLRSIYNSPESYLNADRTLNKAKVLQLARGGREMSHSIYDSLNTKMPSFGSYVEIGSRLYQAMMSQVKVYNRGKPHRGHALQVAFRMPLSSDIEKVFGFFLYSGLIMPTGTSLKGEKGTFAIYYMHFGDLMVENVIVGNRTKSITSFLETIRAPRHQVWPRISEAALLDSIDASVSDFKLSLPKCHNCGTPRNNPEARFCSTCGVQLKPSSLYEALVQKEISVLNLSATMLKRIKDHSQIRKVRDILIDSNREQLRGIKYIGEIRATNIVSLAEEYVG